MSDLGNKEIMASNIKYYMERHGIDRNKVCADLGFKYTTFTDWINAKTYPRIDKIEMMANYFGISKSDLVESKDKKKSSINFVNRVGVQIPILGSVIAGTPISAIEDILGYEEITPELASTGTFFCLKVKGSSMEPRLFEDDIIVVKQQPDIESGEVAVVIVNGDEATVKQIKKADNGITLIGYNVAVYPPTFYSNEDIINLPVTIIGKVIELRRPF
ncbi:LexA family protein [Veillonella sp.]|uniref:LexA family protein n=1 Tax=Veillonella sp. TaxID=1926307 RepID=UPI00399286CB